MEKSINALENAKRMIAFYNKLIPQLERKIELFTIAQEFQEAKYADKERQTSLEMLENYEVYLRAIEFYMEHILHEA